MTAKETVYISGPMRGKLFYNFPAFFECEQYISKHFRGDWAVLNPAKQDMEEGFNPFTDEPEPDQIERWFERDLKLVEQASMIILLPGWPTSKGAVKELKHFLAQPERDHKPWYNVREYKPSEKEGFRVYNVSKHQVLFALPPKPSEFKKVWAEAKAELEEVRNVPPGKLLGSVEVRTTSLTGGQKGVKPARYDLIPVGPLENLAKLYGYGAQKYADRNWEKGYEWSKSYAALMRHLQAWLRGEDLDPEHGLPHLSSVAFHAFALDEWSTTHPEFDDRPKGQHVRRTEGAEPEGTDRAA